MRSQAKCSAPRYASRGRVGPGMRETGGPVPVNESALDAYIAGDYAGSTEGGSWT